MSTPQGGSSRRSPAAKAVAGGKPALSKKGTGSDETPDSSGTSARSESNRSETAAPTPRRGAAKRQPAAKSAATPAARSTARPAAKSTTRAATAKSTAATAAPAAGRAAASRSAAARKSAVDAKVLDTELTDDVDALDTDTLDTDTADTDTADADDVEADSDAGSKTARTKTGSKSAASKAAASRAGASKAGASKTAAKKTGGRPPTKAGGRKTIAPMRVSQGRNWGPIALFTVVILIAVGIIGFAAWKVYESALTVSDRVGQIDGAVNWRTKDPKLVKAAQHQSGVLQYAQNPPVAGKHNPDWQNCMGDVYDAPIAKEHAVHSMEHGAVWVVYDPAKVSKEQIEALQAKVRGKEYSLISPMEGIDAAVSVQAWGFQLKTDDPADKRIDQFIKVTRKNAGVESAACSGGITATGTTPRDLQPAEQSGG